MRNLIAGYMRFLDEEYPRERELFRSLERAQAPETLMVSCSDSRVDLNRVTRAKPGDIFHVRNAGNLVPPPRSGENGVAASIEFAVSNLPIGDIVVCGHTNCGAIEAMKAGLHESSDGPLARWLRIPAAEQPDLASLAPSELTESHVMRQLQNLRSFPFISERVDADELRLHGWIYVIASSRILELDEERGRFSMLV